jgi:cytochrome c oxidase cbb3-type subunit III
MSVFPRTSSLALRGCAVLALAGALGACKAEERSFRDVSPAATAFPTVQTTDLQAGPKTTDPSVGAYQENRWAVSQGQTLFDQYNCSGCHSPGGGGGMGPPLNDDEWIYGSDPENIFATIVEGRPNGMPSFRGKIGNSQLWQIAAYVRSMSGLTPRDTWTVRTDHMQEIRPEREPQPQRQLP